jgi:acyl carrier protein phosphodiesterase
MNYLAHAYLSFEDPELLLGNMISDYIKGKKQYDYPTPIQKGIRLHRAIDQFTDEHAITREIKKFFSPTVRLYAGAFVDVVYDHFLAIDTTIYSDQEWMDFTQRTFNSLRQYQSFFPEKFATMFPYMQSQNWLYNYRHTWGIEKSFEGLSRRAKHLDSSKDAFDLFMLHYNEIAILSKLFLHDIKDFAKDYSEFEKK